MEDPFADVQTMPEFTSGRRVWVLPEGHFCAQLGTLNVGSTEERLDDTGATIGGSPYVDLQATVMPEDSPFAGTQVNRWLYLTPGKGPNLHFLRAACHSITGQQANVEAWAKFNVTVPATGDAESRTKSFIEQFWALPAAARLDMMLDYLRVSAWDSKTVITKLAIEESKRKRVFLLRYQMIMAAKKFVFHIRGILKMRDPCQRPPA